MGIKDIGRLLGADEGLNHQIVETFATLAQSELAWTEKIWCSIARIDGTLQLDFGLGKYQNRGIIDGFGGVSRAREQWTVRASRELHSAPEATAVGPVHVGSSSHRVKCDSCWNPKTSSRSRSTWCFRG